MPYAPGDVNARDLIPIDRALTPLAFDPAIDYRDKYRGALLGVAIGDALGRPAEGRPPEVIRQRFGNLDSFHPWHGWQGGPKGTFTDDTELTIALAESLIERQGMDPVDFGRRCVAWLPVGRGKGAATTEACERLAEGVSWEEAGSPSAGNGAAMRAAPIGLLHPADVDHLRHAAALSAVVTHAHPTAVLSTIALAFLVADLLHTPPGRLDIEGLLGRLRSVTEDLPDPPLPERKPGHSTVELLPRLREMGDRLDRTPEELFSYTYNGAFVSESLAAALWCFLRSPDDPARVVITAANGGYDADTVGAMAGALAGACNGATAWPSDWLDDLEYRDGLEGCADDLLSLSGLPAAPPPEPVIPQVDEVTYFTGPFWFLSNSARTPIDVDGFRYPSVEHAYSAWRASHPEQAEQIRLIPTPAGVVEQRHWVTRKTVSDGERLETMRRLLAAKFSPGSPLNLWLQATGNAHLVNEVWWNDHFWGTVDGQGENHLGRMLEDLRPSEGPTPVV